MPRFTEDEMKEAVLKVTEDGQCVNRVAKENGLCKKTLKSYVDKYVNNVGYNGAEIRFRPNYEINQVFTHQHEQIFEEYLISLDCAQRKITRDFVREEAYNFATMCNVHVPKTWNVRKQAGPDWLYSFLNRHPNVKSIIVRNKRNVQSQMIDRRIVDEENIIRIPPIHLENDDYSSNDEMMTVTENHCVNEIMRRDSVLEDLNLRGYYSSKIKVKSPLDEFLENITSAFEIVATEGFVNADQVYNLGEIALVVDNSPSTNGEQFLVTACCFFNAAGHCLPPFFIFPRKVWVSSTLEGLPEGAAGIDRPTGRLDDHAFSLALEHFERHVEAVSSNKIVLIIDVDEHHITINSLDFCHKCGIELITLPPQYGPALQPAERYIFPTVRYLFNQYLHQFQANERVYFSAKRIAMFFCQIQTIAFSSDHIRNGFSETGIFPLNDLFITDEFLSRGINHYEPAVSLTEISLDFPDTFDNDEFVFLNKTKSPAQYFSPAKNAPFDGTPVDEFLNNLIQAYSELEAYGGVKPEKVYNLNEFEIPVDIPESQHSNPRISVGYYVNALGRMLPPFVVYPESDYSPTVRDGDVKETTSSDGCINSAVFLQMLQHFQQCMHISPSNRIILIMSCEDYHISLKTIEFCQSNGIILVTVPSGMSETFQSLKRTVFEAVFLNLHHQFTGAELNTPIPIFDITSLLARTFESCLTPERIISTFKMSGIWPLDRDLIALNSMRPRCFDFDLGNEDNISVSDDDSQTDEDCSVLCDTGSDYVLTVSESEVVFFFQKIEDFLRESSDEQIYVLGELRLATPSALTNVKLFVNAVGSLLPPYLIYSTDADDDVLKSSLGISCCRCEKNVDDQHLLLESLKHFRKHAFVSKGRKMLLLLENTNPSRLTQTHQDFGEDNDIVFATFPSKGFEHLHPLENSFIKMLRRSFQESRYQVDTINDVIGFLEQALIELFQPEDIVTKFREYGICPIRATDGLMIMNEEGKDELRVTELNARLNDNLKDYEDFIIEEEIEMTVDEVVTYPES